MPSAPPNSAAVSIRDAAEPARSTGALPIARSVIWETTMTMPEASTPQAIRTRTRESVSAKASRA